ncbi:hypothetical protein SISNIDRAFT_492122, partial [Sistotremastrum niveocremeum HHB9708]
ELDAFILVHNHTKRRADKHVTRSRDEPEFIFSRPQDYDVPNWHVPIAPEDLVDAREHYAPPDHQIFDLIQPEFHALLDECYEELQRPEINIRTCWHVYADMEKALLARAEGDATVWLARLEIRLSNWFAELDEEAQLDLMDAEEIRGDHIQQPRVTLDSAHHPRRSESDDSYRPSTTDESDESTALVLAQPNIGVRFSAISEADSLAGLRSGYNPSSSVNIQRDDTSWEPSSSGDDSASYIASHIAPAFRNLRLT